MLFTKIQNDGYLDYADANRRVSTSKLLPKQVRIRNKKRQQSHSLSERSSLLGRRSSSSSSMSHLPHSHLSHHLQKSSEFHSAWDYEHTQTMYIMAALDLPIIDDAKHRQRMSRVVGSEVVLMEIVFNHNNGTLTVRPDFSNKNDDDQWYPLKSQSGSTWRVQIHLENAAGDESMKHFVKDKLDDPGFKLRYRPSLIENVDGWGGRFSSPRDHKRLLVFAQIKKALGFDCDYLRCQFQLNLPHGWLITPGAADSCLRSGERIITRTSQAIVCDGIRKHHLGWSVELDLLARIPTDAPPPVKPAIVQFEVISVDYFGSERVEGYGSWEIALNAGTHSQNIVTWKPLGTIRAQVNNFFLGARVGLKGDSKSTDGFLRPPVADGESTSKHFDFSGFTSVSSGSLEIASNTAILEPTGSSIKGL